jgi:hypothetical protein
MPHVALPPRIGLEWRLLALFLFGSVAISIFDGFDTHSGTTAYAAPVFWQMAWWTPILFGSVVAGGGQAYARAWDALGGPHGVAGWWRIGCAFAVFGTLYYASGYLPASESQREEREGRHGHAALRAPQTGRNSAPSPIAPVLTTDAP